MVVPSAALLALPLTVAVHRTKKPFIYAGFDNLMTDETQMKHRFSKAVRSLYAHLCFICGNLWLEELFHKAVAHAAHGIQMF
jgi:predicted restriction endonuclease